jgi:hypothetical protein
LRVPAELIELGQHEVREVRSGLFAGERWIRTIGPRLSSATSRSPEQGLGRRKDDVPR